MVKIARGNLLTLILLLLMIPLSSFAQLAWPEPDNTSFSVNTEQHLQDTTIFLPITLQPPGDPTVLGLELEEYWNTELLNLATQAGVDWIRRNGVVWQNIEAVEGVRDWSVMAPIESEMIQLSQRNVKLILIVRGVPDWAKTEAGHVCGPIAQAKFSAFASFMGELVERYSRPPFNVRYWELGNEPDFPYSDRDISFGCWGDVTDDYYGGGYYGEMLKVIYPAMKEANPEAQVLIGGLLMDCDPRNPPEGKDCTGSKFLEGIIRSGAGSAFDGVSYHSYDYYNGFLGSYCNPNWGASSSSTGPTLGKKAEYLSSVLEQFNISDKYLINTENALLCNNYTCDDTFERTKAIFAARSYSQSTVYDITASIWYSFKGIWQSTRLVNNSNTPLPAYHAFSTANKHLSETVYIRQIPSEKATIYEFSGRSGRKWVLWSVDGRTQTVVLPGRPEKVWDGVGNPIIPDQVISVDALPVYIIWRD